ncbi:Phosphate starvation-inducible protein [Paramixta manurensis]|uniref:Phosphate starvation-inducible protein n=1 Tax=Paramixta manurensis TaxID=2740817 RepID=A0A6M8U668_9GAMM|nr:Phosphate starvation-inducible protein [Erwiniaceae bacterium PD-1]
MKAQLMLVVVAGLLVATGAGAAEKTPQQQKMTVCNQQATSQSLKGDARKTFMSQCLRKESNSAGVTTQQMKMKTCNTEASGKALKGDARKTFMSQCLKKS